MLRLSQFLKVVKLKKALGIPFNEGACFGVKDPKMLRPPFNLDKTATGDKKREDKK